MHLSLIRTPEVLSSSAAGASRYAKFFSLLARFLRSLILSLFFRLANVFSPVVSDFSPSGSAKRRNFSVWGTVVALFCLLLLAPVTSWAGDGSVDTTFGNGQAGTSYVGDVVVQSTGKVLISGAFSAVNGTTRNDIARLNSDGTLDTTFGNGLAGPNSNITAMAVQSDGKVLIGGYFTTVNGTTRNHIARLNSDGTLDTTFGNGLAGPNGPNGVNTTVYAMAVQSDGKVLIGGDFTTVNGTTRNHIARLNSDGTLDTTFGNGLAGTSGNVNAVAVQSTGKVLIGGFFSTVNGTTRRGIARLNSDGTLDTTFGNGLAGASGSVYDVVVQSDGKVLIGGNFTTVNGTTRNGIARLNSDGTLDTTFGNGLANVAAGTDNTINAVAVQSDGKVLVGGYFFLNSPTRNHIARLNSDGTLDTTFDNGSYENGWVGANDTINAVAVQSDGKVLIGGNFTTVNGTTRNGIARLTFVPDPTITSFTPTSGTPNTTVIITGTNFSGVTGVKFNGVSATSYTVNSTTQITATVPSGATTGPISVTTLGGTATSASSFTVFCDVSVAVSPTSVLEDSGTALAYTFTRIGALNTAITVNFGVTGTATYGTDYTQSGAASYNTGTNTGTVTFAVNATTATVNLTPVSDSGLEPNETAIITLATGTGYNITGSAATGTITNDDTGLVVNTNSDIINGSDNFNSLREAVITANSLSSNDTITVPAGTYTLTIAGQNEDAAATGDLDVLNNGTLTINGPSALGTFIEAGSAGNGIDRVFEVRTGANLSVAGLTIRNGKSGDGGGILNSGTLTVQNSALTNNFASATGGAIRNNASGTLTVQNSTMNANTAATTGGAIYNIGTLTVQNSTLSANFASATGGAIFNDTTGTATVRSSTLSANSANSGGGGIFNSGSTVTLGNSIVASNSTGNSNSPDINGTISSEGYNLIGNTSGATITGTNTGNQLNVAPVLGSLQVNSPGATATMALLYGSPAVNAGSNALATAAGVTTDQRGVARPIGGTVDIGAYESSYLAPAITSFSPTSGVVSTNVIITGTNFSGVTGVQFNGVSATSYTVNSTTQITATVPSGATTGPISVITSTGTATSASNFTVFCRVSVAVSPTSVLEDSGTALAYTFTRIGALNTAITVNFGVTGTATYGTDYTQSGAASYNTGTNTGTVTFAVNATTATVNLTPVSDSGLEPNETAIITLATGTGYNITGTAATGTITNDDTGLIVTTNSDAAANGSDNDNTLREALTAANNRVGPDTITFSSLFNTAQTIAVSSTLPVLGENMAIVGPGSSLLTVKDGTNAQTYTLITVNSNISATVSGLTLAYGRMIINGLNGTLQVGNGTLDADIASTTAIVDNSTLTFNRTSTASPFTTTNIISGTGVVTKTGPGTQILTGANTYSGGTTVSGGILQVNNTSGSGTGTGAVQVISGAKLSGTGTMSGAVTVASGGIHAPGVSGPAIQKTGTYTNNGALSVDIAGLLAGTGFDQVQVTGTATLGATSTLDITLSPSYTPVVNDTFTILTSSGATSGTFNGLANGALINSKDGRATFRVNYSATGVTLTTSSIHDGTGTNSSAVLISQFRLSGPGGVNDEFIELYNNTNASLDVSGWQLQAGSATQTLSGTTNIPTRGHLLITGSAYSLGAYSASDIASTLGNIALSTPLSLLNASGTVVDTVNSDGTLAPDGTIISTTAQYALVRRAETGTPNGVFNLVSITRSATNSNNTGTAPFINTGRLGAPGPRNLYSPIQRNNVAPLTNTPGVNETAKYSAASANYNSAASALSAGGQLSMRRTLTNNTGATATKLRFRITAITAGSAGAGLADLRAISSKAALLNITGVTVNGLSLESPSVVAGQGGGLNSSWTTVDLTANPLTLTDGTTNTGGLPSGKAANLEFLFGINNAAGGSYRVLLDAELLP